MLKRMLAFSSDRFCWHTGTPVKESYLKEREGGCQCFVACLVFNKQQHIKQNSKKLNKVKHSLSFVFWGFFNAHPWQWQSIVQSQNFFFKNLVYLAANSKHQYFMPWAWHPKVYYLPHLLGLLKVYRKATNQPILHNMLWQHDWGFVV